MPRRIQERPIPPEGLQPQGGFLVGDVVYHQHDPIGAEGEVLLPTTCHNGELALTPWGPNSGHLASIVLPGAQPPRLWRSGDWRLLMRPARGARIPNMRPATPTQGMGAEDDLSEEFVFAVAEWVYEKRSTYDRAMRVRELAVFLSGRAPLFQWVSDSYTGNPEYGLFMDEYGSGVVDGQYTLAELIRGTLIRMRSMAVPADLCHTCTRTSATFKKSATCGHFVCARCARQRSQACDECSTLRQVDFPGQICTNCCTHQTCDCGCGEAALAERIHGACGMIAVHPSNTMRHCTCPRCDTEGCIAAITPEHGCDHCRDHCQCGTSCMPLTHNELHFFTAHRGEKGMTRLLGTELETAGAKRYAPSLKKAVAGWKCSIVRDGSIGGRGMELVTAPAGGSQWVKMISDLGVGFKDSESFTSVRCGQHVHVDARDVDAYDMARIIRLYAVVEQSLFDALPMDRINNHYCMPSGPRYMGWLQNEKQKLSKKFLAEKQYGLKPLKAGDENRYGDKLTVKDAAAANREQLKERTGHKYDSTRYSALNLHSYWHRGTIEFRHAHGTNNAEQIINWGLTCGSIVDWAVKHSDEQLLKLLASQDGRKVLLEILPNDAVRAWLAGRWTKFTNGPGQRDSVLPAGRAKNGEI